MIRHGKWRGEKIEYPDGIGCCIWIPFDEDASWDERREVWKLSNDIVRTTHITQSAIGQRSVWTTVLAAAVLLFDRENGSLST